MTGPKAKGFGGVKNNDPAEPSCMIIEVIGNSSVEYFGQYGALNDAIERLAKTLPSLHGFEIVGMTGKIKDGRVSSYRVVLKLSYDGVPRE